MFVRKIVRPTHRLKIALKLGTLLLGLSVLSSCGRPASVVSRLSNPQQAPGFFFIPPKVDILLAEDDTGSMSEAYAQISTQMPGFLNNLQSRGWDYHFATIPLTKYRQPQQVVASQFDSNWGSQWIPAFPGATPGLPGTVSATAFRRPDTGAYTEFLTKTDINNSLSGKEPGFQNIRTTFENGFGTTQFLRSDALLVVIGLSNGEDTSGVAICTPPGGVPGPCNLNGEPDPGNSAETSFQAYKAYFQSLKADPSQFKFFAAASAIHTSTNACLGGTGWPSARYPRMARETGGVAYDICSQPVASVLDGMSNDLHAVKLAYRMKYLVLQMEPEMSGDPCDPLNQNFPHIIAFRGGQLPGTEIKHESCGDPSGGWRWVGMTSDYLIDSPVVANPFTGYAIELVGGGKLEGDDRADVQFLPKGATNAVGN